MLERIFALPTQIDRLTARLQQSTDTDDRRKLKAQLSVLDRERRRDLYDPLWREP